MALNFDELMPTPSEQPMSKRAATRTLGPNPFLENGWLQASYDAGQPYDFGPVSGGWETVPIKRGDKAGQSREKLTGDAATVVSLLRAAADHLGIGVTLEVVGVTRRGKPVDGQVIVKYLGKQRKRYNKETEVQEAIAA